MRIETATVEQLSKILSIYEDARRYMADAGNPEQWGDGYPSEELIRRDIAEESLYLCVDGDEILGVFYYREGEDPTYRTIEGAWLNDRPYGVIHRIAVASHQRGVASFCFDACFARCKNLKIDTHERNFPMQRALQRNGFVPCGIIRLENGAPRIAYQRAGGAEISY